MSLKTVIQLPKSSQSPETNKTENQYLMQENVRTGVPNQQVDSVRKLLRPMAGSSVGMNA